MADPQSYKPSPGEIPASPGVYRFRDERGTVIYVGKAKSLRSRLSSYFHSSEQMASKTWSMVTSASSVDWVVVGNEREALQLEYQWIKEYAPRFNIKYRDDKSYPYLAVTLGERFPRALVMRGKRKPGSRYFGPFAHAWAIRETVDILLRVFPMRSCSPGTFRQAERSGRPCLLAHIGRCSAPCIGQVSESEHRRIALDFCDFMAGGSSKVIQDLSAKMSDAAVREDFESAARYRDDIDAVHKALERTALVLPETVDADVIGCTSSEFVASVAIFHIRAGRVRGQRAFAVERVEDVDDASLLATVLGQFYDDPEQDIPTLIVVPWTPGEEGALSALLQERKGSSVELRVPQRGRMREFLDTAVSNAEEFQRVSALKRGADLTARSAAMNELRQMLELPAAPYRIECIDISHTSGTNVVGSLVVFVDGRPEKRSYRSYIIKGDMGTGDVAAISEVVSRRFRVLDSDVAEGARNDGLELPDLLVVDGAGAQADAAAQELGRLNLQIPVVGLAKRMEEVWLPSRAQPVILPRTSEALFLLQRVRDESHRTAIGLHRKRRSRSMLVSALDSVPGLGLARKRALLERFGSIRAIQKAEVSDIADVKGISESLARTIKDALDVSPIEASVVDALRSDGEN